MKKSQSAHKQDDIWFRKTNDKYHIRLRKNHEVSKNNEGEEVWLCDEAELYLPLRQDIDEYIKDNFDMLFNNALFLQ